MSEYWISDDGDVEFADGDVGDYNHEAVVIRTVQSQIIDRISSRFHVNSKRGHYFDGDSDWDEFKAAAALAYAKELVRRNPAGKSKFLAGVRNDPDRFFKAALKEVGVSKVEYETAEGGNNGRKYAMERWGWKTYRNGNIDTWRLTRKDMQAIISGVESISNDDGWSEKKFKKYKFGINVFSTKKHFYLTIDQMQKWLSNPTASITQDTPQDIYNHNQDQALSLMHPHYHNRPGVNPFGDSVLHSFKTWLETDQASVQQIFPYFSQEDPPDYKKIGRYVSKDNYVKAMTKGSKKTELSAEKMVSAAPGSFFSGADEEVEKIWNNALSIPAHTFAGGQTRPEMKMNLVLMISKKPLANNKYRLRLLAYYGGMVGRESHKEYMLTRQSIKTDTYRTPVGGLIMIGGYITHAWVDNQWRGREPGGFSLFNSLRNFARMYLGVHGTEPGDDLTSKSYRTSQAKHDYERFLKWKSENGK